MVPYLPSEGGEGGGGAAEIFTDVDFLGGGCHGGGELGPLVLLWGFPLLLNSCQGKTIGDKLIKKTCK